MRRMMCEGYGNSSLRPISSSSKRYAAFRPWKPELTSLQAKAIPTSITLSPNSSHFVTLSLPDRQVRIFNFLTGKKTRQYDESLTAIEQMQQAGTAVQQLEPMEFYRRMAVERELNKDGEGETCKGGMLRTANAVWDETGNFILYPSLLGIKGEFARVLVTATANAWQSSTR